MTAESPPGLPSFSSNWVGGDIHGLWALAATLYGYVPQLNDVVTALDKNVSEVAGAAGWQGRSASAFCASWDRDATAARALGLVIGDEAGIVGQLSLSLATIEHALESAAQTAEQHGVQVGPDGQPPQSCFADPARQRWAQAYQVFWEQCRQAARQARHQAASALDGLYTQISPDQGSPVYDKLGQADSLADYVRGLFAIPTVYRKYVEAKLPELRQAVTSARVAARENARGDHFAFSNGVLLYGPISITPELAAKAGLPAATVTAFRASILPPARRQRRPEQATRRDAERLIRGLGVRLGGTIHGTRPPAVINLQASVYAAQPLPAQDVINVLQPYANGTLVVEDNPDVPQSYFLLTQQSPRFFTAYWPPRKPSGYGITESFPPGYLRQQLHAFRRRGRPQTSDLGPRASDPRRTSPVSS